MKIKSIKLKDFKRFTDLKIEGIPEKAKLVVMIGPIEDADKALEQRVI